MDLIILVLDHGADGVPDAEPGQEQGGTAADAEYGHQHTPAVAEDVAERDLVQEAEAVPERGDALEQDLLTCCRGFRTNEPCRRLAQVAVADKDGRAERRREECRRAGGEEPPVEDVSCRALNRIQDAVYLPERERQEAGSEQKPNDTAEEGGAPRINEILRENGAVTVAERLQRPVLRPPLADHARHGRDAHERRDEEEEEREHFRHAGDDGGIVFETGEADVRQAVEGVHRRCLQRVQRRAFRRETCLRIGNLLFCHEGAEGVQFCLPVGDLSLPVRADGVIARVGALREERLDRIAHGIERRTFFVGINGVSRRERQIDLRIDAVILKPLRRQVDEPGDGAVGEGRAAALKIDVSGGVRDAYDGVARLGEIGFGFVGVAVREGEVSADLIRPGELRVEDTFVFRRREPPGDEVEPVDPVEEHMGMDRAVRAVVFLVKNVVRDGAEGAPDAPQTREGNYVVVREPERGDEAVVIETEVGEIPVRRFDDGFLGDAQTDEEADPERDNGEDREVADEGRTDGTQNGT